MSLKNINESLISCNKLNADIICNLLKFVDKKLLEPIPEVETTIYSNYDYIWMEYKYKSYSVSVYITSKYIIICEKNDSIMMYEGDGEELSVNVCLFSTIMDILNRFKGENNE